MSNQTLTGYPSIDKPWLKYYSERAINATLPKSTIYEYLYENNKNNLDDIALNYFDRKITYKQLFENIEKTAKAFSALGVKESDIVTISSVTTPEIIYAFYALNRLGAISNMVDPRTSTEGITHYIEEVNSKFVITIDIALPKIEKAVVGTRVEKIVSVSPYNSLSTVKKVIVNTLSKLKGNNPKMPDNCITWNEFISNSTEPKYGTYKENTCCVIVHTGGTTGMPKGVMLSDDNLNAIGHEYLYGVNVHRKEILLDIMPPFIAFGLSVGLHAPLVCGTEVVVIPQFNPNDFGKLIKKYRVNHYSGVPTHFITLMNTKKIDLSCFINPGVGGDAISVDMETKINNYLLSHNCKTNLIKGYGMTELCATVAVCHNNETNEVGSVGIPMLNMTISAFDTETGEELSYNQEGEICISGPTVMLGYYKNNEETNKMIKTHSDGIVWLHSGDLGEITADGVIYIKGRIKRVIVRYDGFKVFPTQIESVVLKNNLIDNCCAVGTPDKNHTQGMLPIVFAVLKNNENEQQIKSNLFELCKSELPEYAQPIDFIFIDKLPLTPIGKVDYRKLEEMAKEQ